MRTYSKLYDTRSLSANFMQEWYDFLFILFSNKNDNRRERIMNPRMNFCLFADGGLGETALFGIEKGGFLQFVVLT